MADNKKTTPLDVSKVKRGVKGALTPGEQPEKEKTPIEKVISRELTEIVKDIDFDSKFKSIITAIESKESESLLPILEKINKKLNPLLGILFGVPNVNDNTNTDALLSKLGNLKTSLTMFGPIDFMLNSIYKFLIDQAKNKSSYKLEDLATAVSDEIKKFLKEIDNRPALKHLTKILEEMKYSVLSNSSSENINKIYSKLEVIKNLLSNNKTIDYTSDIEDIAAKINSIANNTTLKDNSKEVNLSTPNLESYDSIIESINDNANFIVDIMSEKFNDIINPINKLVNSNDFNLRTAQIIDAIKSSYNSESKKEVDTTALKYKIDINASGLDTDTVKALIDLSKINTDSNDYLKNLDNIISSLSNFEKLNDIELDNKNIEKTVNSLNILSKIKISDDAFNPFSVDCLKYFIDTLGSIDLSALKQFDEDSLESISIIKDTLSSFSNLSLENFNKNIQSLNAEEFVKLLNILKDIPVYDKEDKTTMTSISDLFSAISSISGFDNKKFEDLSSNLRKMIRLTEKPETFKKLKVSDRGLIHVLMHNIGEISSETKETFDNTKNIGKMLNLINGISQYDPKSFDNLKYVSSILALITSEDEPYLYKVFKNIEKIGDIISAWDKKNGPAVLIGYQLKLINEFSSKISLKNISLLAVKSAIAWNAMYSLAKVFEYLKEIGELSNDVEKYINSINNVLVGINSINTKSISHLDEVMCILVSSFRYLKTIASISSKDIDISKHIDILNSVVEKINTIEEIKNADNLESIQENLKNIIFSSFYLRILSFIKPKEIDISKHIDILNSVVEKINTIEEIKNAKNLESIQENLKSLIVSSFYLRILSFIKPKEIDISKYVENLNDIVNKISNIEEVKDTKNIESLNNSLKSLLGLNMMLTVVGITMPLAYLGSFAINIEISLLKKVVGKLNEIEPVKEEVLKNLKTLSIVIFAASGILLLGAFVGGFVLAHFLEVIGFTVALSAFIFLTIGAFNEATRGMEEAKLNAEEFGKLLLISGGIMLLGGTIMTLYLPLILGSIGFAYALGAFIFSTIFALNIATQGMDDAAKNAKDFAILIGISAAVMLLGGTIMMMYTPLILGAFAFTGLLTLFILTTIGALNLATIGMNEATKNAKDFAILIGISAAVMLLGGFIILNYSKIILGSIGFSLLLGLFILLTIGALNLATRGMNEASKNAKEFAIIIGVSAAALLIGGLFMLIPGMPEATWSFAWRFVLFLGITLLAYAIASKHIEEAKKTAIGFAIVVFVTSLALLIGGGLLYSYPGLDTECLKFAGLSFLFIVIFGGTVWLLGKIDKKSLIQGELALAGIAVLIGGFGYAFTFVAEAMDMISKVKDPWKQLGIMGTVFGAMIALVAVIVALTAGTGGIGAAAIAVAEGIVLGLIVLIGLMGLAMSAIAQSMIDLDKAKNFDASAVTEAIKQYISLVPVLSELADIKIVLSMMAAKKSISSISEAIMDISTAVKEACDLKTSDGRSLTPSDFTLAAENVKSVVTILGRAIIDTYKENEDIFSAGAVGDFLGMDTPFSRVSKSCSTLGKLITKISAGVKDFAELKMPIYDENGQFKGYRTMNDTDFENAAIAVKKVVTCLGGALIAIYNEKPDMFSWELIGDNPFVRVSKSCSTLGKLITKISAGVKDFAELRMPIYDENGKLKGYRTMNDKDFENAATAVQKVVSCLGGALIAIYNEKPYMFSWELIGDNPFVRVSKSCSTLGKLLSDISAGIKDFAELRMPIYDKNGKITGYRPMGLIDFINAQVNIGFILTCLANAIMNVYRDPRNKGMFTDPSLWHTSADKTPFGMVVKAMSGVGALVKDGAAAIKEIADMKVNFADLEDIVVGGKIKKYGKVSKIVSIIARSIKNTYESNKDIFTDDSFWHTDPTKTPFGMVTQCLNNVIPLVKTAAAAVNELSQMKFKGADLDVGGDLYKKIYGVVSVVPKAVIDLIKNETYGSYLTDSDYIETYGNMKTAYSKFSEIIKSVIGSYEAINNLKYDTTKINGMKDIIKTMLENLCSVITSKNLLNKPIFTDSKKLEGIVSSFSEINKIIREVSTAYDSISKTLTNLGVKNTDTSVINTITSNLNSLLENLILAINVNVKSLDKVPIESFTTNVSSFYSSIETFASAYKLIPNDLSKFDNFIKAIEEVNVKIAEIKNLETFKEEQESLEKYVTTLNNLDLTKVQTLSNLMTVMNMLASKLGSLDKFTDVLNTKISLTLSNLAKQIKISGDIINKADDLQKQRHKAIKDSIKEIQSIMDQKLIVEVNHFNESLEDEDYNTDTENSSTSGGITSGGITSDVGNKGQHENGGSFHLGENNSSQHKNTGHNSDRPHYRTREINYELIKTKVKEALREENSSGENAILELLKNRNSKNP